MRWLKIFLIIILLYGFQNKQFYYSSAQATGTDPRIAKLQTFLKGTPLYNEAEVFIREADKNGLDWKLLAVVGMVESSGGKRCWKNCFGWSGGRIDFGDNSKDIAGISDKLSTLSYYKTYLKTGRIEDFCLAYNRPYAKEYCGKLMFFYTQL